MISSKINLFGMGEFAKESLGNRSVCKFEKQTCSQMVFKASPSENNFPFPVRSETDPRKPKAVDTSKSYLHSRPVEVSRVQIAWTN